MQARMAHVSTHGERKHAWRTQAAWAKKKFTHGSFPEVGQKQKTEKEERERAKVGDNNGQATHGERKHAWRTQAAWAKNPKTHHETK